jgi:hypothetical protein
MTTPPPEPPKNDGSDAEKHFWDEHDKRTRGILDKWFDEKAAAMRSSARGPGRSTLPKIFADLVFGPEKTQQ